MKTICYVDGFNLYYGCLKATGYKWLDLYKLFAWIINENNPDAELHQIKFFTAPIKTKLASRGDAAGAAQNTYHRALNALYPEHISICEGYFSLEEGSFLEYLNPPDKTLRVKIWRLEEKQSDVNIALEAYRDASYGAVEQAIFVTNDTDQEPTLKALRHDFPELKIGIILPIKEPQSGSTIKARPGNNRLSVYADWTRGYIRAEELKQSQLPDVIPTRKKAIRKPVYW
ncbi:MAG: NYN domain-containing protein [Cellvibrio sp. 79]|nr:MAG: NYN domain-containing protein [Cellvibrio sp. 79]